MITPSCLTLFHLVCIWRVTPFGSRPGADNCAVTSGSRGKTSLNTDIAPSLETVRNVHFSRAMASLVAFSFHRHLLLSLLRRAREWHGVKRSIQSFLVLDKLHLSLSRAVFVAQPSPLPSLNYRDRSRVPLFHSIRSPISLVFLMH